MLNHIISLKWLKLYFCLQIIFSTSLFANSPGAITSILGEVTQVALRGKIESAQKTSSPAPISLETSYVTQEQSQIIIEFQDGTKLKVGALSKVSFDKKNDAFIINLDNGHVQLSKKNNSTKFYIKTTNALVETTDSESFVTFKPLFEETSLYVERGLSLITKRDVENKKLGSRPEMVHGMEYSELKDSDSKPKEAKKLKEKEMEMVKKSMDQQSEKKEELE